MIFTISSIKSVREISFQAQNVTLIDYIDSMYAQSTRNGYFLLEKATIWRSSNRPRNILRVTVATNLARLSRVNGDQTLRAHIQACARKTRFLPI